jgi:hypothetical protein
LSGNTEIIRRFEHAFRAADQATIDELSDPGLVDHNPAPGHEPTLAGFKHKVAEFKAAFPASCCYPAGVRMILPVLPWDRMRRWASAARANG